MEDGGALEMKERCIKCFCTEMTSVYHHYTHAHGFSFYRSCPTYLLRMGDKILDCEEDSINSTLQLVW